MKKLICATLSLALMGACALAESEFNTVTQTGASAATTIKTTVAAEYTIKIPAELNVEAQAETTNLVVEATSLRLASNQQLKLSISSEKQLKDALGNVIAFTIEQEDAEVSSLVFDAVEAQTLQVKIAAEAWAQAYAGDYSGAITFNSSIENKTEQE